MSYTGAGLPPQYALTLNNLDYTWLSLPFSDEGPTFSSFVALDDSSQSLYLGFDQTPLKGPISIFALLREQEYTEQNRPRLDWEYFRQQTGRAAGEWVRLLVDDAVSLEDVRQLLFDPQFLLAAGDSTLMLSRSVRLFFTAPPDMERYNRHPLNDELLLWLRATVRQAGYELSPVVDSISLNSIDDFQHDTVSRAILFSSSGEPNQTLLTNGYLEIYAVGRGQCRRSFLRKQSGARFRKMRSREGDNGGARQAYTANLDLESRDDTVGITRDPVNDNQEDRFQTCRQCRKTKAPHQRHHYQLARFRRQHQHYAERRTQEHHDQDHPGGFGHERRTGAGGGNFAEVGA
jgi:hypothetical protein